jgi:multiple sugar transport system permease protein
MTALESSGTAGTTRTRRLRRLPLGRRRSRRGDALAPTLLLLPATLIVLALRVVPMIVAVYLSFTDTDLSRPSSAPVHQVGLDNYRTVLGSADFRDAVTTTVVIVGPALILEMGLGLAIALWLARPMRAHGFFRGATLVPYLLVPVVIGNFFRMFYSAQFGQLNYYLSLFGITGHAWLTEPGTVRWTVVAMEVWHTTPFVALLCLAGLTGIPREPIEAALVDGANAWQRFRYIMMPVLWPILGATLALRAMDAIQLFDEVYVLTGGGPGRLSSVINLYLYQFGFRQFRIGQTSAAVTVVVGTIGLLALIAMAVLRSRRAWKEVQA